MGNCFENNNNNISNNNNNNSNSSRSIKGILCSAGGFSVTLKSAAASSRQFIPATAWFEGGEGGAKLIWLEPKVFRCQ
ncbi:hypothetical protein PoB_005859200 [Plakobranchus ocellatus]|uniref:Uncharacterized protein n=1 Tax=Plakobranchus ocellatus TaxID=259542 RepID=A0AAV4CKW6_9GAST|nr:hypothetical protein PoB_005859200 [Plakobranchus ocellatus]